MMVKLSQKGYISFIFNLFSLQLYTHLEQYNNMLKNSKKIMTIKMKFDFDKYNVGISLIVRQIMIIKHGA